MRVKSNAGVKDTMNPAIIGTYEGEVLDSNITNKNGLDITVDVMQAVLESEDYRDGIENGWFIGFLGHPEDPGCQEFKDGCIVMTDMWIDDNNKVHGKFDLLNTPVGQIVKTYIDAGVKFGISIRGAGDIIDNSVDPDTFVFRGFDLVAFPAYPNSIPEFSQIAASTDIADRKKYKILCKAVMRNLGKITSASTLDVLQSQFAKNSDVYKAIKAHKDSLKNAESEPTFNMSEQKIESMMSLYLETVEACKQLHAELDRMRRDNSAIRADSKMKIESIRRITSSQITELDSQISDLEGEIESVTKDADSRVASVKASMQRKLSDAERSLDSVRASSERQRETISKLTQQVDSLKNSNLIYKQRIDASTREIESKDSAISDLKSKLRETVTASTDSKRRTSNLDAENNDLRNEIEMCRKLLREYQDAYASMYAASIGIDPNGISVRDDMSVSEMRKTISSATNTVNIGAAPSMVGDCEDDNYDFYADYNVDGMITM